MRYFNMEFKLQDRTYEGILSIDYDNEGVKLEGMFSKNVYINLTREYGEELINIFEVNDCYIELIDSKILEEENKEDMGGSDYIVNYFIKKYECVKAQEAFLNIIIPPKNYKCLDLIFSFTINIEKLRERIEWENMNLNFALNDENSSKKIGTFKIGSKISDINAINKYSKELMEFKDIYI